jgi:hypothetical protein
VSPIGCAVGSLRLNKEERDHASDDGAVDDDHGSPVSELHGSHPSIGDGHAASVGNAKSRAVPAKGVGLKPLREAGGGQAHGDVLAGTHRGPPSLEAAARADGEVAKGSELGGGRLAHDSTYRLRAGSLEGSAVVVGDDASTVDHERRAALQADGAIVGLQNQEVLEGGDAIDGSGVVVFWQHRVAVGRDNPEEGGGAVRLAHGKTIATPTKLGKRKDRAVFFFFDPSRMPPVSAFPTLVLAGGGYSVGAVG